MIKSLKNIFLQLMTQKIVWRTTFWIWGLLVITIIVIVLYTISFQRETLRDRMENECVDIANSILHANSASLITEDYGSVVDHCSQLVSESNSILYVVVTRNDGFSLVFINNQWFESYDKNWLPSSENVKGEIIWSKLLNSQVFQKPYKVNFSGI